MVHRMRNTCGEKQLQRKKIQQIPSVACELIKLTFCAGQIFVAIFLLEMLNTIYPV